jgi:hypothetical protein
MPISEKMQREVEATAKGLFPKTLQKVLLKKEHLAVGEEKRLHPKLDVGHWDRLHFMIASDAKSVAGVKARVLFGWPMPNTHCGSLLADSTVWFEDTVWEREFCYTIPTNYGGTGFAMSVPVIAPQLYDVILMNTGNKPVEDLYVTVMAQEI